MRLGRKDYTIAVKTGTDANKAKFKKECVQGEIYHATDTGFFYIAEVTAGLNDATLSQFGASAFTNQYSVSFDGTEDYIQLPNGVLTALSGTAYTISMWYNLDIVGSYQEIFTAGSNLQIYFRPRNPQVGLELYVNGASRIIQNTPYSNVGSWVHGCISVDTTGTSTMYINGSSNASSPTVPQLTSISNPVIGSFNGASLFLNGYVDEVAIFNSALSASDVSTLRGGASAGTLGEPADISSLNPVGWWRMGDGSDGSGNADGTLVNIGGTDFPQIYNVATDGSGNRITGIDGSLTNIASPNGIVTDVPT